MSFPMHLNGNQYVSPPHALLQSGGGLQIALSPVAWLLLLLLLKEDLGPSKNTGRSTAKQGNPIEEWHAC